MQRFIHSLVAALLVLLVIYLYYTIKSVDKPSGNSHLSAVKLCQSRSVVTFVSALFNISNGKRPFDYYIPWLTNFLQISKPILMWVDSEATQALVERLRPPSLRSSLIVQRITWEKMFVYKYIDQWKHNHQMDPEKHHHSPELYMIWAEKSAFLQRAMEMDPFYSQYFYWVDTGYVRDANVAKRYSVAEFPSTDQLQLHPKILLLAVEPFTQKDCQAAKNSLSNYFLHTYRVGGGMFGGHHAYVQQWASKYYEVLERFFAADLFAGKDQAVMNHIAVQNPQLVELIRSQPLPGEDPWFYLLEFLASTKYQPAPTENCSK